MIKSKSSSSIAGRQLIMPTAKKLSLKQAIAVIKGWGKVVFRVAVMAEIKKSKRIQGIFGQ